MHNEPRTHRVGIDDDGPVTRDEIDRVMDDEEEDEACSRGREGYDVDCNEDYPRPVDWRFHSGR